MQGIRWERRRRWPTVAALAGVLVIGSAAAGAAAPDARPPPGCGPDDPPTRPVTGRPWFRLEPVLVGGGRDAQRLELAYGRGRTWTMRLDAESFATGPTDGRVVVGTDDGRRSTVSIVDTARGCRQAAGTSADVVRSAVLADDGTTLYEHRVRRGDRADLGIWRRPVGAADATRVLPPIEPDARFGPTWLTELRWAGRQLVVSTCGEVACRLRLLDPLSGAVRSVSDPRIGSLVGAFHDRLAVRGACRGLPCPVLAVDPGSGDVTTLDPEAGQVAVTVDPDGGATLVVADVDGHGLRAIDRAGRPRGLPDLGEDVVLTAGLPEIGLDLPPGWIGLLDGGGPAARQIHDPAARRLEEVRP